MKLFLFVLNLKMFSNGIIVPLANWSFLSGYKKLRRTRGEIKIWDQSSCPVQSNPSKLSSPNHHLLQVLFGPVQSAVAPSRFHGSSNSWRSSLTTISPVGTSWSSSLFVIGPLEPWSFFISANRISVLPKKSGGKEDDKQTENKTTHTSWKGQGTWNEGI